LILSAARPKGFKRRFYSDRAVTLRDLDPTPTHCRVALLRHWIRRFTTITVSLLGGFEQAAN